MLASTSSLVPASGAGADEVAIREVDDSRSFPAMLDGFVDIHQVTRTGTQRLRRQFGVEFLQKCKQPASGRVLLGHGGFGAVFNVELNDSDATSSEGASSGAKLKMAVKAVFNYGLTTSKAETNDSQKEFDAIRGMPEHRNIVRVIFECVCEPPLWMVEKLPDPRLVCLADDSDDEGMGGGAPLIPRKAQLVGMELLRMPLGDKMQRLERVSGGLLEDHVLAAWGLDIAEGLLHMLLHGVVHRDLKLDNVMWDSQGGPEGVGRAVIIDLGCSLRVEVASSGAGDDDKREGLVRDALDGVKHSFLSVKGGDGVGGNQAHLAPEVLDAWYRGAALEERSVVVPYGKQASWALGVLLHELATGGQHPFGDRFPGSMPDESGVTSGKVGEAVGGYDKAWAGNKEFKTRPGWFQDLVRGLLRVDPAIRTGLGEAARALRDGTGSTTKGRPEAAVVVLKELREALKSKDTRLMKQALDAADKLKLSSSLLVKMVRTQCSILSRREQEREQARIATDDEDEEATDLLEKEMKAREEKYARAEHERFTWTKYARIRSPDDFASGVFFGKARIKANQLQWQSNTIISSLIEVVSQKLVETARLLHKNILGYCGDKTVSFPAKLAQEILHKGLEQPDLVDEIYVQILKQLTNNPRPDSALRAWQLMCMCMDTFPPSHDFENFLLNFLLKHKDRSGAVGNYARFALRRLEGIMNSGPMGFKPTEEEINAYKERPPVLATIELVDGTVLTEDLPVTPDLNVGMVMSICRGFLELQDPRTKYMGLFVYDIDEEVEDKEENKLGKEKEGDDEEEAHISQLPKTARPLRDENFLGDVVTIKVREQQKFRLVYKRKIFLPDDEPDVTPEDEAYDERFEQLMHQQAVDDIINNNIRLDSEQQVCLFVALAMVVDYGADVGVDAETLVEQEIMEYVPCIWRESHEAAWWAEKTVETCEKEGDQNPLMMEAIEARKSLMRMAKSNELYGTFFFHVKKKNDRGGWSSNLPENMYLVPDYFVVGIKFSGLHFYDPDTMEELALFGFKDVYRWGGSKVSFCLELWFKELEDTRELEMWTGQAPGIASLMLDYINAVMEVRAPGS